MAAHAYFKNAAAQLRSAAADLRQQASQLETEFDRERRDLERAIKANEAKMTALTLRVVAKDNDESKNRIEQDIINMKQENDHHSQRIGGRHSEVSRAASDKMSLASRAESLAGQIDGLASSSGAQ